MSRTQPRILLAHWEGLNLFGPDELDRLGSVGTVLNAAPISDWSSDGVADLLADADVILGHWGCPRITADVLDQAPNLGLFAYAAGTIKNVVSDALWEQTVRVTTGANANAIPVAEYTLASILFANKGVFWRRGAVEEGGMRRALNRGSATSVGNYDKTIGIVGASLIGRIVLDMLAAFPHLDVLLYDPYVEASEARELGATKVELDELCATSDVVSLHAPMLETTHHMIGAAHLAAMRDGATLINTGRGPLVDHVALTSELVSGRLNAVLDVTDPDPLPADSPLHALDNVYLTPHLAGSQGTELNRMLDYVIEEIRLWTAKEPALNEITRDRLNLLA